MNEIQATDEMLTLFREAWESGAPAFNNGQVPLVEWPGVDPLEFPPKDSPWARVNVQHGTREQSTLGGIGNRAFEARGILVIQIFTPRDLLQAQQLAIIARNAFEGVSSPGDIWFRNVRMNEVGTDASWSQINVVAEFEYHELK